MIDTNTYYDLTFEKIKNEVNEYHKLLENYIKKLNLQKDEHTKLLNKTKNNEQIIYITKWLINYDNINKNIDFIIEFYNSIMINIECEIEYFVNVNFETIEYYKECIKDIIQYIPKYITNIMILNNNIMKLLNNEFIV
jgi:hypothetical protein